MAVRRVQCDPAAYFLTLAPVSSTIPRGHQVKWICKRQDAKTRFPARPRTYPFTSKLNDQSAAAQKHLRRNRNRLGFGGCPYPHYSAAEAGWIAICLVVPGSRVSCSEATSPEDYEEQSAAARKEFNEATAL